MRGKASVKKHALAGLAAAMLVAMAASEAAAFCVYNKSNAIIRVVQVLGGADIGGNAGRKGFSSEIKPGANACCNWQSRDCNSGGAQNGTVAFIAEVETRPKYAGEIVKHVICAVRIPAGGSFEVSGRLPSATIPYNPSVNHVDALSCRAQ